MSKFFLDPFDSKMLCERVFKLEADARLTARELRQYVRRHSPEVVCATVPFHRSVIRAMEAWGATLVSIHETYTCSALKRSKRKRLVPFRVILHDPGSSSVSAREISRLAQTFSSVGRFGQDEQIPRRTVKKIYEVWITNSLYHGYADAVWYVERGGRLAGLLTLKRRGKIGVIDLLAVRPEFQGRGLGRALMDEAEAYVPKHGLTNLQVGVEGENVAARAFYQKYGFVVQDVSLVYHWHAEHA